MARKHAVTAAAVQGVAALVVCALLAAVALRSAASAPPAVAELSPDAVQTIVDAPPQQAAAEPAGGATTTSTTAATATTNGAPAAATATTSATVPENARVRRCIANGDGTSRQTEDPQSPPCVAFSEYDATTNGGPTAQGVTADSVTISIPTYTDGRLLRALEAYYNDRYELHGRRLRLVPGSGINWSQGPTTAAIVAEAVRTDEETHAFAATGFTTTGPGDDLFYDELARRGVVSVSIVGGESTTATLNDQHPYRWSLTPTYDTRLATEAAWICSAFQGTNRTLGVVYANRIDGSAPDLSPLLDRLANCNGTPVTTIGIPWNASFTAFGFQQATDLSTSVAVRLRTAGVTTVLVDASMVFAGSLWMSASLLLWEPEWILGAFTYPNSATFQTHLAPAQMERTMAVNAADRELPPTLSPMMAAIRSVDPGIAPDDIPTELYQALTVIAAGIQHAGPNLTPETFGAALQEQHWSNTGTGPPLFQASVGFGPGDHAWYDDANVLWWKTRATSARNGRPGALCYLDGGRRFTDDAFPVGDAGLRQGCP